MTGFQRDYLTLIQNALDGTEKEVSEDFDWIEAFKISKMHQTESIVYYGAIKSKSFQASEIKEKFIHQNYVNISISEKQIYIFKDIQKRFNESKISFLPLKGIILKSFYPYAEMRTMGDIDIFIKTEEYDRVKTVLIDTGFSEGKENEYELHWDNGNLHIELHKSLIPPTSKDIYSYYEDGWKFAIKQSIENYEYRMSDEDFFIYIFTHFAKHYRGKGAGIKYVVDFYVFFKTHPYVDREYIKMHLKKMELNIFYENILKLINVWFFGETSDQIADFLTKKIFSLGVYGRIENSEYAEGVRISKSHKHVKTHKFFKMLFPSFLYMKDLYPILGKVPVLLPFCWIARWLKILFTRGKDIKNRLKALKHYEAEAITKYKEELNYVGLVFNFKE